MDLLNIIAVDEFREDFISQITFNANKCYRCHFNCSLYDTVFSSMSARADLWGERNCGAERRSQGGKPHNSKETTADGGKVV